MSGEDWAALWGRPVEGLMFCSKIMCEDTMWVWSTSVTCQYCWPALARTHGCSGRSSINTPVTQGGGVLISRLNIWGIYVEASLSVQLQSGPPGKMFGTGSWSPPHRLRCNKHPYSLFSLVAQPAQLVSDWSSPLLTDYTDQWPGCGRAGSRSSLQCSEHRVSAPLGCICTE